MSPRLSRPTLTPWGELTAVGRVRRSVALLLGTSVVAMIVSASTADSDWNITAEDARLGR